MTYREAVEIIEDYTREMEWVSENEMAFILPPEKAALFAEALRYTET